jgi:hypothetical protein
MNETGTMAETPLCDGWLPFGVKYFMKSCGVSGPTPGAWPKIVAEFASVPTGVGRPGNKKPLPAPSAGSASAAKGEGDVDAAAFVLAPELA